MTGKMKRDRKKKQKEPYNNNNKTKKQNQPSSNSSNVRWKKGKFRGNVGLSDTRASKGRNENFLGGGSSNRNSSTKFRVTLDGSGDFSKKKRGGGGGGGGGRSAPRRNNNNNNNSGRKNGRGRRAPPLMVPQPRSAADLDADLDSYKRKAPKKPATVDDLDAEMDAYNAKRKQPVDEGK